MAALQVALEGGRQTVVSIDTEVEAVSSRLVCEEAVFHLPMAGTQSGGGEAHADGDLGEYVRGDIVHHGQLERDPLGPAWVRVRDDTT